MAFHVQPYLLNGFVRILLGSRTSNNYLFSII